MARLVEAEEPLDPMSNKRTRPQARSARSEGWGVLLRSDGTHNPKIAFVISTHAVDGVEIPEQDPEVAVPRRGVGLPHVMLDELSVGVGDGIHDESEQVGEAGEHESL
jgi:hypothetical protein